MGSDKACLRCGHPLRGARAQWRYCTRCSGAIMAEMKASGYLTRVPSLAHVDPGPSERAKATDFDGGPGFEGAVRAAEG